MTFRGLCQPQPLCDPMKRKKNLLLVLEVFCTEFVVYKKADFVTGTFLSEQKPKDGKYIPYSLLINKIFFNVTLDRLRGGLHLFLRVNKLSQWYSAHRVFHLQYMLHFLAICFLPIEISYFTNDCLYQEKILLFSLPDTLFWG